MSTALLTVSASPASPASGGLMIVDDTFGLTESIPASPASGGLIVIPIVIISIILIAVVVILFVKNSKKNNSINASVVCPQCGKIVKNGKNFCISCGAKVE
jgi:hypothetical protein